MIAYVLYYSALITFDYDIFTFSAGSLETQEFYGNKKRVECSEFEDLDKLGQFQLLELLYYLVATWRGVLCPVLFLLGSLEGIVCHPRCAPIAEEERWCRRTHSTSSRFW